MSIRKQMILYFSCVMVVIFTLTELINGWQAYRQLEKNMTASVKELLNLSVKNMDYYFQDTSNVCLSIMADERTQNILQQEIGDDLDGKILERELNKVVAIRGLLTANCIASFSMGYPLLSQCATAF